VKNYIIVKVTIMTPTVTTKGHSVYFKDPLNCIVYCRLFRAVVILSTLWIGLYRVSRNWLALSHLIAFILFSRGIWVVNHDVCAQIHELTKKLKLFKPRRHSMTSSSQKLKRMTFDL